MIYIVAFLISFAVNIIASFIYSVKTMHRITLSDVFAMLGLSLIPVLVLFLIIADIFKQNAFGETVVWEKKHKEIKKW